MFDDCFDEEAYNHYAEEAYNQYIEEAYNQYIEEAYKQHMKEVYDRFHTEKGRVELLVEEGKIDEAKALLRELTNGFDYSVARDDFDALYALTKLVGEA